MTDQSESARKADAAVAGAGAVEHRAVDTGLPRRQRRGIVPPDQERADSRGVYRDTDGRRRVVGAGSPVPADWTREADGDLAARTAAITGDTPTPPEDAGEAGGRQRRGRKRS